MFTPRAVRRLFSLVLRVAHVCIYADCAMSPRHRYTFYIDAEQRAALAAIKERDGISESEQIRRAVKVWIEQKGGAVKVLRPNRNTPKGS